MKTDPNALDAIRTAAARGLFSGVGFLLEEANRTVPIEEATLAGSGVASVDAATLTGVVSYDTPYAVRQHEDQTLQHDAGRRAKWLEATFKERGQDALDHVAGEIRRATR